MSSKTILLYGYGANVGAAVLKKFASQGWKTAAVVRTTKDEYQNAADIVLQGDFSDAAGLQKIYGEVERRLGTPNCVVYNAYSAESFSGEASRLLEAEPEQLLTDLKINTVGFYATAAVAQRGFAKLGAGEPKVFIFTGNGFPTSIVPEMPGLGGGKAASAYVIEAAAKTFGSGSSGRGSGSRWYFADERLPSGGPTMMALSGEHHAEAYYGLATATEQGPWNFTFVGGQGYVDFPDVHDNGYSPIAGLIKATGL